MGRTLATMVWLLCASAGALFADDAAMLAGARTMKIPHVRRAPTLQDYLEGKPREAELALSEFRQREPGDGVPVSQPTVAYLSYDDKQLYAVFVCKDDPSKVRAHLAKRDNTGADDGVGIVLDTFHDLRRAYFFWTNPLGVQNDAILAEGQSDDYTFDAVWHSEGRLTEGGYIVYMAIPFRSLRFTRRPVQEWGIVLARFIRRNNEASFMPYLTRRISGTIPQAATLQGIENVSPGRNMQFIPYVFAARARTLDSATPAINRENEFRGGVDGKLVLHDSLSLDVTVNPDFSQVESDEPQVTVNQRYEVYYPERRPFFIENSDFFKTPETLFFSRRIVDPEFGSRLTGSVGRWKVGALAMDDRAAGSLAGFAESDPRYHDRAMVGVARVRREFRQQSSLGVLFTSRDFAGSYNRVYALDTRLVLNKQWTATAQAISTNTEYLDGTHTSGPAYLARIDYSSRNLSYYSSYTDRSPSFHTDLGFATRTDIRWLVHYLSYTRRPKKSKLLSYNFNASGLTNWNRAGQIQDWNLQPQVQFEFPGQTYVGGGFTRAYELYQGIGFDEHWIIGSARTQWLKWASLYAAYYRGQGVNYYPAAGYLPFPALDESASGGFGLRPWPQLQVSQTYLWYHLGTLADAPPPGWSGGVSIFNNHIARTTVNWQLDRRLSLRFIADYNALLSNPALVNSSNPKKFTGDVLFTYTVNPWTAVYVGYTDTYENLSIQQGQLVRTSSPTVPSGRQVFVKLSYLLRF